MSHIFGSLVFKILSTIHHSIVGLHVILDDVPDPGWNRCRKKQDLQLLLVDLSHLLQDIVDIFFEPKLEHLVRLIKNYRLKIRKVDIAPINMILDSSRCANKYINSPFEFVYLLIDIDPSIHCDNLKLIFMVLQFCQLV